MLHKVMLMNKNTTTYMLTAVIGCASLLALSACSTAKEQLGLEKSSPDEFQVVKHAPLEMPPTYSLRPPRPGTPRPQEQAPINEARESVFGAQNNVPQSVSSTENALLQQAGATNVDPNIRDKVNKESAELKPDRPGVKKLLNIGRDEEPEATIVDADKERERLQQNKAEGKPVTEGETPSIDRQTSI